MCCSFFLSLKKQYAPSNWSMETYFHLFKTEKFDWNIVRIPFNQLCAENRFYVQALKNRKKYLKPNPGFFVCINSYVKIFIKILVKLFRKLVKYLPIDNLIAARKIINNRLYFSLLPFRVWNHLFQCWEISMKETCLCLSQNFIYLIVRFVSLLKKNWLSMLLNFLLFICTMVL